MNTQAARWAADINAVLRMYENPVIDQARLALAALVDECDAANTRADEADRLLIDAGAKGDDLLSRLRFYMDDYGAMEDRAERAERYVAELHGAESIEQMEVAVASIETVQAHIAALEQALRRVTSIYTGLAEDTNDGTFALWSQDNLIAAIVAARAVLADRTNA